MPRVPWGDRAATRASRVGYDGLPMRIAVKPSCTRGAAPVRGGTTGEYQANPRRWRGRGAPVGRPRCRKTHGNHPYRLQKGGGRLDPPKAVASGQTGEVSQQKGSPRQALRGIFGRPFTRSVYGAWDIPGDSSGPHEGGSLFHLLPGGTFCIFTYHFTFSLPALHFYLSFVCMFYLMVAEIVSHFPPFTFSLPLPTFHFSLYAGS